MLPKTREAVQKRKVERGAAEYNYVFDEIITGYQKNFEFYHTLKLQEFPKVEFLIVIKNVNL